MRRFNDPNLTMEASTSLVTGTLWHDTYTQDTRMEMGRWQEQKFGDMRRIQEGMEAPE